MSAPGTCTLTIAVVGDVSQPRTILAGSMVRFLVAITDIAGTAANTTLDIIVGTNYYDEEFLTVVNDSTGQYHADWDTTSAIAATYYCNAIGTGALEVAAEISIPVKESHL